MRAQLRESAREHILHGVAVDPQVLPRLVRQAALPQRDPPAVRARQEWPVRRAASRRPRRHIPRKRAERAQLPADDAQQPRRASPARVVHHFVLPANGRFRAARRAHQRPQPREGVPHMFALDPRRGQQRARLVEEVGHVRRRRVHVARGAVVPLTTVAPSRRASSAISSASRSGLRMRAS